MLDKIKEAYPSKQFIIADGFDEAVIGVDEGTGRIIY